MDENCLLEKIVQAHTRLTENSALYLQMIASAPIPDKQTYQSLFSFLEENSALHALINLYQESYPQKSFLTQIESSAVKRSEDIKEIILKLIPKQMQNLPPFA